MQLIKQPIAILGRMIMVVVLAATSHMEGFAQRINFSTWTGSDQIQITSSQGINPGLNFNQKQAVIKAGSEAVNIILNDPQVVMFAIEAPQNYDLTIELTSPEFVAKGGNPNKGTIPLQLRMAYNNQEPISDIAGVNGAIELPAGFQSITIPVNKRMSGAPTPPPTPEYENYTAPTSTAYVYIYGTLGPVGTVTAGAYSGDVQLNVYISNNGN